MLDRCGHDWGGVVACKLAAEAPQLADRFIVSNTAHVSCTDLAMET